MTEPGVIEPTRWKILPVRSTARVSSLERKVTPEFRRLIAYQVHRAREFYASGRRLLPYLPVRARACVGVMAGIYSSILDEIERRPSVIFRRRVGPGTGKKLALAGRELVRSVVR